MCPFNNANIDPDNLQDPVTQNEVQPQQDNDEQQNDPVPDDEFQEQDDTVAQQHAIAFDSCLQPADVGQELMSFGENIYSIAPAQGNNPVNFFKTPKLESMAFPVQFNTGKNTLDEDRPRKLSPSRYFNARLFSADNRFAVDSNYIFFAQFVTEMNLAMSSMSIQLRKGKVFTKDGKKITTSLLKSQNEVQKLVRHGDATRFMQPLRGTPAYWQKTMRDLFACLKQLGQPTFFVTFSAAEMRWPEIIEVIQAQRGEDMPVEEMDWATKADILRSNPVTIIRMFEKRVEALMRDLILSPAQPLGEVLDFFFRVEFQARGSAHIHSLFWIKDAPQLDVDPEEKVTAFIDRYVSCQLPDEATDPELHKIVKEVQTHSKNHTKSCKKGNKHCRFGFPKRPVENTFISRPTPSDPDRPCPRKESKDKLKPVWDLLQEEDAASKTIHDILAQCEMSYDEYENCLHNMNDHSAIMMKRNVQDCWINGYNPDLLRAWNANMDIQFIDNPESCIMYLMSYISKPEYDMSEFLKGIIQEVGQQDASDLEHMKQIMQAYSKNREVSIQEAVTRICGLKLKSSSRNVVFIPTDDNALKMSLPMKYLDTKDPNSEQVWMTGLAEKYKARPQTEEFQNMCMADFASNFRPLYGQQKKAHNALPLLNNMGHIQKRTRGKPAVIRYARFSEKKDPEKYYGTMLKVFLPYRTDRQLKIPPYDSYESFYQNANVKLPGSQGTTAVKTIVETNRKRYEKGIEIVEQAIRDFQEHGVKEDAWASFAPNSELLQIEALADRQPLDPIEQEEQDDVPEFSRNSNDRAAMPLMQCPPISSTMLKQMYQNLNQTQAKTFYKVRDWALQLVNNQNPEQFFLFIEGGAGTGKSHLIKCIYNEVTKILRQLPTMSEEQDVSKLTVLLTSFTGTAAFNISGNTLHSVLKLPKSLQPPYQGLGNSLDELRVQLSRLQIIIIDEVSMVSKELFTYVDLRLQQIKGSRKPFGGVSVLSVGDFYQLSPVGKSKPLCVSEGNAVDTWNDHFQMITLTQIMRQKDDATFAEMLNRLRVKKKSETLLDSDKQLLATRTFAAKEDCPADVLHIFATNKQVDNHNHETITSLSSNITLVDAEDYAKDERTGRMVKQAAPFNGSKGDLPDTLLLSVGARIVITRNLDTSDGIVNGSFAKITKMISKTDKNNKSRVELIGLEFDNPTAGTKRRALTSDKSDNTVYIDRIEERCKRKGRVRHQFPIRLAYSCTAHKVQGMTSSKAVVSLKRVFEAGMAYVALSRTTSLEGLHIIDFDETKIYCNEEVLTSLKNMPHADLDSIMPLMLYHNTAGNEGLSIIHHNVEGLHCHLDDVKKTSQNAFGGHSVLHRNSHVWFSRTSRNAN